MEIISIFIGSMALIIVIWQRLEIKALNDKVELLSNDSEAQEAEISTLIDTIITLRAEIEGLKPKLAQEEVEKSKDMQLAEQWDNVINFNPLKDLEVAHGN